MKEIKNKNIKWWIGAIAFLSLFIVIGIFSCKKMSFVFNGVKIEANLEKKESSSLVTITGTAKNAKYISLNGREIFIDKEGRFFEVVSVLPGFSVITINATDKFGKNAEKKFEIVREKNAEAIAFKSSEIIN